MEKRFVGSTEGKGMALGKKKSNHDQRECESKLKIHMCFDSAK